MYDEMVHLNGICWCDYVYVSNGIRREKRRRDSLSTTLRN